VSNSPQYPLQASHRLRTLCELASLNMGGPSSNPIRCANQDSERKDLGRGIGPEGNDERKKPFKSKCDSGMNWAHFMTYGVIKSISMSASIEGALAT
jgi:hypothetical protein